VLVEVLEQLLAALAARGALVISSQLQQVDNSRVRRISDHAPGAPHTRVW